MHPLPPHTLFTPEQVARVLLNEKGGRLSGLELGVAQHILEEGDVGLDAAHLRGGAQGVEERERGTQAEGRVQQQHRHTPSPPG